MFYTETLSDGAVTHALTDDIHSRLQFRVGGHGESHAFVGEGYRIRLVAVVNA